MNALDLYLETIGRSDQVLRRALEGLSIEDLQQQAAGEGSNPIGWLTWHLSRVRDGIISNLTGEQSIWDLEGWASRFGIEGEAPRLTPDNVHTFDPRDPETLLGYFEAVSAKTVELAKTLTEHDLERVLPSTQAGRPPQTVGSRLGIILNDNIQHIGQIAYLRGMIRGQGWF
jgi:uncharacterized damage-inducible protein DinB